MTCKHREVMDIEQGLGAKRGKPLKTDRNPHGRRPVERKQDIHTSDAETYRPLAEIVADLDAVEAEAQDADRALREILKQLGI